MKKIAVILSIGSALSAAPLWAGLGHLAASHPAIAAVAPGSTVFFKDIPDSVEGDPESDGVVDPTPQDDGSDGVDDGSGDGQPA
ncbi:MAG TPA: hypothetical protein VGM05_24010 [Planctomycetaceae bacterium]|jgi:hypothetical protein